MPPSNTLSPSIPSMSALFTQPLKYHRWSDEPQSLPPPCSPPPCSPPPCSPPPWLPPVQSTVLNKYTLLPQLSVVVSCEIEKQVFALIPSILFVCTVPGFKPLLNITLSSPARLNVYDHHPSASFVMAFPGHSPVRSAPSVSHACTDTPPDHGMLAGSTFTVMARVVPPPCSPPPCSPPPCSPPPCSPPPSQASMSFLPEIGCVEISTVLLPLS